MRTSNNEIVNGHLRNGFDYDLQLWVEDYIIQDCGHFEKCDCKGRKFRGQDIRDIKPN